MAVLFSFPVLGVRHSGDSPMVQAMVGLCARSIALLTHRKIPFSSKGHAMAEAGNGSDIDVLPRNFYKTLEELTEKTAAELEGAGPDVFDPAAGSLPLLLFGPAHDLMVHSLALGYESHSAKVSSGSGRMWAAWALAEAGLKSAVPVFERNLRRERSVEAAWMYRVSLARLAPDQVPVHDYLARLGTASLSATRWTKAVPFRLGSAGLFDFYLSDRGAIALALAYYKAPSVGMDLAVGQRLVDELDALLLPAQNDVISGRSMRFWAFQEAGFPQTGVVVGNAEAYLPVLLFAIGQRQVAQAYPALSLYFNSLGHYPAPALGVERSHVVPVRALVAAMYRINRSATLWHLVQKVREARFYLRSEGEQAQHSFDGVPKLLEEAAGQVLSELDYHGFRRQLAH